MVRVRSNRFFALLMLSCAALLAVPAMAQTPKAPEKPTAFDKATLEAYVRHLFVWPAQINVRVADPKPAPFTGFSEVRVLATLGQASKEEVFYVSQDGQKILQGTVFDISRSPFQDNLAKLRTDFQPSFGTPGAPVVIAVFSDFQCGYCREEAKTLRQNLPQSYPSQVRLYFKDYPLDQIHPWARPAAIAGRCVFRQKATAFWDFHDWIFEKQPEITAENLRAKVTEWATSKGLDMAALNACVDSRATEPEIDRNLAEGRSLGVDSTPTLFLNGRKLPGSIPWPNLKQVIDFEIGRQQTTGTGGEKCCEVKIPSPVGK